MYVLQSAQLIILEPNSPLKTYTITDDQVIIGRAGGANNLSLFSHFVSSQHCIISAQGSGFILSDLASLNGTYVNSKQLKSTNSMPTTPVPIHDGDVISIGDAMSAQKVFILFSTTTNDDNFSWKIKTLIPNSKITVGRDVKSDICVPNITASRKHAVIARNGNEMTITDLQSSNGTIFDNATISNTVPLSNFSVIRIGSAKLVRIDDSILYSTPVASKSTGYTNYVPYNAMSAKKGAPQPPTSVPSGVEQSYDLARQGGVEVRADNISRKVPCKNGTGENGTSRKYILKNISLTIKPGEMVAILGDSGAGKTTFMNCINGFEPATEGSVYINSTDLYKNYQAVKSNMGYVPQQDIVHDDLSVQDILIYTGKLRLPKDVSKSELGQRVTEVLDMVDLTAQRDTVIKKLSGGQRKRASIAVELISDPALFFLDEPTSGLDPEAENNLMHQLQNLSQKKGKTVIVITHTLQNIRLFDKVIFLASGGKLCFYG